MTKLIGFGAWVAAPLLLVQLTGCGTTTCETSADCLVGEFCNADNTCEPILVGDGGPDAPSDTDDGGPAKCTIANEADDCDGYACLMEPAAPDGTCLTECKDNGDCADGYECNTTDETCGVVNPTGYVYVAIVSTVPFDAAGDLNHSTPGPDIDAIEVIQGGASYFANAIVSSMQGAGGTPNSYDTQSTLLGANDAILDPDNQGSCDVGATEDHWWSMGDETGWEVASFVDSVGYPLTIQSGDTVRIYELDNIICSDAADYEDTYDVYVGLATADTSSAPSSATFTIVGSSSLTGGIFVETVD